jgi:hypothetical protein
MRVFVGCVTALVGGCAGMFLFSQVYGLIYPAHGCMFTRFGKAVESLPYVLTGGLAGAVLGAWAPTGVLTLIWSWQARQAHRDRRSRRRPSSGPRPGNYTGGH